MHVSKKRLAGLGLVTLATAGLTALSSPAFAQATMGWYGHTANGAAVSTLLANATTPPIYSEQGINDVLSHEASALTLPTNSGIAYVSNAFTGTAGVTQATLTFTFPPGDVIFCSGPKAAGAPTFGGMFTGSAVLATVCVPGNGSSTPASLAYTVTLATTGSGQGWLQLPTHSPPVSIDGTNTVSTGGTGLATLATYTNNPPNTAVNPGAKNIECNTITTPCDVSAVITPSQAAALLGQPPATIMVESANTLSLQTSPPHDRCTGPIYVDLLSGTQPGTLYSQSSCNSGDTAVADKGIIEVDETYYLGPDGVDTFNWDVNGSNQTGIITLFGACPGLMQNENIGSQPASCGLQPFTDDSPYLVFSTSAASTSGTGSGDACYAHDEIVPTSGPTITTYHNPISGLTLNGAQVTFTVPLPNDTNSDRLGTTRTNYFELCDKAVPDSKGNLTVLGAAGSWDVQISVDCPDVAGTNNDCTTMDDTNTLGDNGVGGDQLLPISYNGNTKLIKFVFGAPVGTYVSFLRVVNRMQDTQSPNNKSSGCVVVDPANADGTFTCEPIGQVVCKVTSDSGYNGYATLWTNATVNGSDTSGGSPFSAGLLSGKNALYYVPNIFADAGVGGFDPTNPNFYGSLECFYPDGISLEHLLWENGTLVEIH